MKAIYFKAILLLLAFPAFQNLANAQSSYAKIADYKVYYGWASHYPQDWLIIRSFINDGKNYLLLVDPQTLKTKIDEPGFYKIRPMTWNEARTFFKKTPYMRAITKAERRSAGLQDAGSQREEANRDVEGEAMSVHSAFTHRIS